MLSTGCYAPVAKHPLLCAGCQANVMLEYSLDDAEALLNKNCEAAVRSLQQVDDDLGFLRDQTTTIEVSILVIGVMATEASPR